MLKAAGSRYLQVQTCRDRLRAEKARWVRRIAGIAAGVLCLAATPFASGKVSAMEVERSGNHLVLSGEIAHYSPGVFNRNLVDALLELALAGDRDSPIFLHLNLPRGGDAAASFRLLDILRSAQAQGTQVVAQVSAGDTCMSGCTFLFLAADERWMAPEGRLVFHGFTPVDAKRPAKVPERYIDTYYNLLAAANQPFFEFFKSARIIEDDRKVGFTGQTLHDEPAFDGLITGLIRP